MLNGIKRQVFKSISMMLCECNETVVSLSECRDIYPDHVSIGRCDELIDLYDKSGRQLYKLGKSWTNFKKR
jgi:hypothetical protein